MATHQISMLNGSTFPDNSGDVFQQPYSIIDTATIIDPLVWVFADSGNDDNLYGRVLVPQNYVGSPKVIIIWNAVPVTNEAVFDLWILSRGDNEDPGAAADHTNDTVTTTVAGTTFFINTSTFATMSATDIVKGEQFYWSIQRQGADANDDLADALMIHDLILEYADA